MIHLNNMEEKISGFNGQWRFLSNFYETQITYEGITYPSVENAYQAAKTISQEERLKFVNITAKEAKSFGKKITLRDDWEQIKIQVMWNLIYEKFTRNRKLLSSLLLTGDTQIEETNWWGDRFWGVCKGEGENHLGKLLMKLREKLKN